MSKIEGQVKELKILTADNAIEQENIVRLKSLIEKRISFAEETINDHKNGEVETVIKRVSSGIGQKLTDEIEQVIQDIDNAEETLLTQRLELAQSSAQNALNTCIPT